MGVATAPSGSSLYQYSVLPNNTRMSESYQHLQQAGGIFSFPPNGLERSAVGGQEEEDHHHHHQYHQQIRHKHNPHFRIQQQEAAPATGFELPVPVNPSVPNSTNSQQLPSIAAAGNVMDDPSGGGLPPSAAAAAYESTAAAGGGGMLSEMMFNFGVGAASSNNDEQQQHHLLHHNHHQINSGNHESATAAAAMQLFLTNPQHHHEQQRPGSPTSHPVAGAASPGSTTSSAVALSHMFAPNHQSHPVAGAAGNSNNTIHTFLSSINQNNPQFTWINRQEDDDTAAAATNTNTPTGTGIGMGMGIGTGPGVHQGQGLSLSLSSSLKADHHRHHLVRNIGGTEMMFFGNNNNINQASSSTDHNSNFKDFGTLGQQQQQHMMLQYHHHLQLQQAVGLGGALTAHNPSVPVHLGLLGPSSPLSPSTSSLAVVNVLRNSKYSRAAQELLEEFCSVGRGGHLTTKNKGTNKLARNTSSISNNNNNNASNSGGAGDPSTSTSNSAAPAKDNVPPLSPADRMEHQRRKVKLISMLDEVERRYSHYCEQMQGVVNMFDLVMGFGAATPYTALAQKAMSRHFRCLKDAIQAQLKHSCELLGEKDITGSSGLSKGETPRLKVLEQSLRHQRAFHQMGMMDQEAWRPQRGLPERSVNVLRSWLFEHFLHPYPNDADKHLLARLTGLSRNQVSNWFINARVRLWKPMVEEMYQQEDKEREDENERRAKQSDHHEHITQTSSSALLNPLPTITTTTSTALTSSTNIAPPKGKTMMNAAADSTDQGGAIDLSSFMHSTDDMGNAHNMMITTRHNMDNDYGDSMVGVGVGGGAIRTAAHHFYHHHQSSAATGSGGVGMGPLHFIRFGTTGGPTSGDVSLTLGLRHGAVGGGTAQDNNNAFSFRDFGS